MLGVWKVALFLIPQHLFPGTVICHENSWQLWSDNVFQLFCDVWRYTTSLKCKKYVHTTTLKEFLILLDFIFVEEDFFILLAIKSGNFTSHQKFYFCSKCSLLCQCISSPFFSFTPSWNCLWPGWGRRYLRHGSVQHEQQHGRRW